MRVKEVPFSWIDRWGKRLDCNPFMGGAVEARFKLEEASYPKDPLNSLTTGHNGGIYNGPQFRRNYVDSPEHGVQFLTSSTMLRSDLTKISLLRKSDAESNKLSYLRLSPGTTMISCSGTIGRMVYARPDMDGMWTSQDVLKAVPNPDLIPPGYLYTFLSSKFGLPLILSGTYGAIIQHIEPAHIADLPVPRLGDEIEGEAHALVENAARERSQATIHRSEAIKLAHEVTGWKGHSKDTITNQASSTGLARRLDAFHHSAHVTFSRDTLAAHPKSVRVGSKVESIFEPNRGSRMKVDDPQYGVPFLSSSEVFRLDPCGEYLVSRTRTPHIENLLVSDRDLLLPRSGQLGGIVGRAVLPLPVYYEHAASEHLVRIRCHSQDDAFYLWAFFASEPGYLASIGTAFGSSIPSLDCQLLAEICIPWLEGQTREKIIAHVRKSVQCQNDAIYYERTARTSVEQAI